MTALPGPVSEALSVQIHESGKAENMHEKRHMSDIRIILTSFFFILHASFL